MYCFILYISLAIVIRPGSGMTLPVDSESDEVQKPEVFDMKSMKSLKNAAEIVQLLKFMNKGNVKNKSLQRQKSEPGIDIDYLGVSHEKSDLVNELMEMIKKNYNNKEKRVVRPHERLIYISNPEVLEEYKKQQKSKQRRVSLDSNEGKRDDISETEQLLDVLQHLRRFDQLQDQKNEEPQLDKPDQGIGIFTLVKSKVDDKVKLRTGNEDQFASDDDKFDRAPPKNDGFESKHGDFESKHDNFDIKNTKFKKDVMKSSGEKPKKSWPKKKDEDRFKDDDRRSEEFNSKKNRNEKKTPKTNPMLSKIQMQDNPSFGNFGSLSKPRPKPIAIPKVKREHERERERERERPRESERPRERERERPRERPRERERSRDTAGAVHSFGRTPVPFVGKRGIYEDDK